MNYAHHVRELQQQNIVLSYAIGQSNRVRNLVT